MNKPCLFLDTLSSFSAAKTCWPTCTRLIDVRLYFSRKHQTNTKKSVKDKLHWTYILLLQQPTTSTYNTEFCLCSISSCVSNKHSCLQSLHTLLARAQIWQKTTKHHSSTLSHMQGKKSERCNDLNPTPHWKQKLVHCVFISPWVYMANRALKSNPPPTLSYNPAASARNKNVPWKNTPTKTDTHPHWGCQVNQRSLPRMPMSQRPHRLASRMMEDRVLLKYSKRAFWRSVCIPSSRFRNLLMFW